VRAQKAVVVMVVLWNVKWQLRGVARIYRGRVLSRCVIWLRRFYHFKDMSSTALISAVDDEDVSPNKQKMSLAEDDIKITPNDDDHKKVRTRPNFFATCRKSIN